MKCVFDVDTIEEFVEYTHTSMQCVPDSEECIVELCYNGKSESFRMPYTPPDIVHAVRYIFLRSYYHSSKYSRQFEKFWGSSDSPYNPRAYEESYAHACDMWRTWTRYTERLSLLYGHVRYVGINCIYREIHS